MPSYVPVNSVLRSLEVLTILNRQRVTSIDHIHKVTKLPKPTIVRILETLAGAGFVAKENYAKGYRVTSQVTALSCGFHGAPLAVEAGRPWTQELTRVHKWPAAMAVPDGNAVVVCDTTCGESPMAPYHALMHKRLGMISMALGRAYLAFCPPDERRLMMRHLEMSEHPDTPWMASPGLVEHMVVATQKSGFAERTGSTTSDASSSVAVPIFELGSPNIVATIGLTYYSSAVRREEILASYVPDLKEAAQAISESMARVKSALNAQRASTRPAAGRETVPPLAEVH